MKWRLILKEYNPEFIYIQCSKNITAYVLSRLYIVDSNNPIKPNMSSLTEHFLLEKNIFYIHLITKLLCDINKLMNL